MRRHLHPGRLFSPGTNQEPQPIPLSRKQTVQLSTTQRAYLNGLEAYGVTAEMVSGLTKFAEHSAFREQVARYLIEQRKLEPAIALHEVTHDPEDQLERVMAGESPPISIVRI